MIIAFILISIGLAGIVTGFIYTIGTAKTKKGLK
jgi:hypothetical protein